MTDPVAIEQLTIDDATFVVSELPEDIQAAVRKYEDWRDRYAVAQDELQLVSAALRDLGAQIVAGVRQFEEKKAADAAVSEGEAVTEVPAANESPETLVIDDDAE